MNIITPELLIKAGFKEFNRGFLFQTVGMKCYIEFQGMMLDALWEIFCEDQQIGQVIYMENIERIINHMYNDNLLYEWRNL